MLRNRIAPSKTKIFLKREKNKSVIFKNMTTILTARYCGPRAAMLLAEATFQRFCVTCWSLFASFSFCVSANFTTRGDEQPWASKPHVSQTKAFACLVYVQVGVFIHLYHIYASTSVSIHTYIHTDK